MHSYYSGSRPPHPEHLPKFGVDYSHGQDIAVATPHHPGHMSGMDFSHGHNNGMDFLHGHNNGMDFSHANNNGMDFSHGHNGMDFAHGHDPDIADATPPHLSIPPSEHVARPGIEYGHGQDIAVSTPPQGTMLSSSTSMMPGKNNRSS